MSYTIITDHGIAARDDTVPWEQNAPGLYTHARNGSPCVETVVQLDSGEHIALSVECDFRDNDLAVHLCGWARRIEEDGSSTVSPDNVALETSCSVGVSNSAIAEHTLQAFKAEVLKALLGETPTMLDDDTPLMWIGDEQRQSANVRNALVTLAAIGVDSDITDLL